MLNAVGAVLFARCVAGVAVLASRAPRPPRVASLAFLVVASFLLVNKVWSPQYSLWLVPLAVLALPRWRLLLAWMAVDALVWVPRMFYYVGGGRKGLPPDWFLGAVLVRDAMVVAAVRAGGAVGAAPGRTDPVRASADDPDWPATGRPRPPPAGPGPPVRLERPMDRSCAPRWPRPSSGFERRPAAAEGRRRAAVER